jgi:hypothetical protein
MSPEETQVAPVEAPEAPVPAPEAVAAPPAAPEAPLPPPEPAPEVQDERSKPTESIWKAMFDRVSDPTPPSVPEQLAGKAPGEPKPARTPRPVAPAPTPVPPAGSRTWAGKYETPEAMESAHLEAQQALRRAELDRDAAKAQFERMERLLYATMQSQQGTQPQQAPQAPPTPQELQQALDLVKTEHERLAMSDPEASPLALVRAIAIASALDEQARTHYANTALREVWTRAEQQQQIQSVQDNFFEHFPDLRQAHPSLLRQVAIDTESRLRRQRGDYGSPAYMQEWFNETAKLARAHIRLGDSQGATPPSQTPAPTTPPRSTPRSVAAPRAATGAPFSETPTPRVSEPQLTGQDVYLARVFGRQP